MQPSLLQAEQLQLFQPGSTGDVVQCSRQLCHPALGLFLVVPVLETPDLGTLLQVGFTGGEQNHLLQYSSEIGKK